MVQVQPFDFGNTLKSQNLADRSLKLRELALGQQQERFNQSAQIQNRRIALTEEQHRQAAARLGLQEQEYQQQVLSEVISLSPSKQAAVAYGTGVLGIPQEVIEQIPDEMFGQELRLRQEQLDRQGQKVLSPGQRLVDTQGNVIAEGGEKPPTPSEQLKIEQAERTEDRRERSQQEVGEVALALLSNPATERVFGTIQGRLPSVTAAVSDAEADVDRLVAMLSLDAREALKGTGQISDFESKQLGAAATVLSNKNISDERALEELQKIAEIFGGIETREKAVGETVGRFKVRAK